MNLAGALFFVRPWWFVALLPLAGLLWLLARKRFSSGNWEKVCDEKLLPFMLLGHAISVKRRGFVFLTGLAGLLVITALAGPVWERLPQPVVRDEAALVVVFDLSLSMNAVDIRPNRLTQARFKISDLLARRKQGQTGLVVYARNAFTVVPITDDNAAIELYLQSLDTSLMPRQGSRADLGLQEAFSLLQGIKVEGGDILLVTDYADARVLAQAQQLSNKGYAVSVMGVGTDTGGPVSLPSGEFLSHKGEVVVPQLDDTILSEVARAGGGVYVRFNPLANSDIERLTGWLESRRSSGQQEEGKEAIADVWREEGPWLLLLTLPIVLLGFRRGVLAVAAFALWLQPYPAYALDWDGLWLRPDQQAARALREDKVDRAAGLFDDKEWKAVAQYKSGDFAGAVETLETLDGAANWYNKGNSLVGAGELQQAIEAYRHALEIDPGMEDATHNMAAVRQFIEQMQAQQQARRSDEEADGEPQGDARASGGEPGEDQQGEDEGLGSDGDKGEKEQGQELASEDEGDEELNEESSGNEGEEGEDDADGEQGQQDAGSDSDGDTRTETLTEKDQAIEQWLRGVSDNPKPLLKRKLEHLSRKKKNRGDSGDKPW